MGYQGSSFKRLLMFGSARYSAAETFLRRWSSDGQGLVFDFATDQSIAIRDTTTPANSFASQGDVSNGALVGPGAKLTYTSPSLKMTMGSSGTLRYQAHNLFLNSAAPANQSVTVVSGATYSVILTGSVTTTLSGAATGTITAGTTSFTAATTTLTFGSTSGTGTVQVTRTPADLTYLATAGSALYVLPYEWNTSGVLQGIMVEEARTNLALWNSDFTNAAWTKSNMTTAQTATGPDGVSNSATTLTATAGNATALQAITSASSARITSCYIKRRTGTGNIDLTQDNGSTWATVTVTSSWTRVEIASVTSTNPTVGIRVVTSGDAVDVALFQHTIGAFVTSPIQTFASTVTRAADNIRFLTSQIPFSTSVATLFVEGQVASATATTSLMQFANAGLSQELRIVNVGGTALRGTASTGASASTTQLTANTNAKMAAAFADSDVAIVLNGGSPGTDVTYTPALTSIDRCFFGGDGSTFKTCLIKKAMYLPRRMTNSELQALTA